MSVHFESSPDGGSCRDASTPAARKVANRALGPQVCTAARGAGFRSAKNAIEKAFRIQGNFQDTHLTMLGEF
jgi:hypothetical protein